MALSPSTAQHRACAEIMSSLPTHARLLLNWCKAGSSKGSTIGDDATEASIHWPELLRLASHHKLISVVNRAVKDSGDLPIADQVLEPLRRHASGNARRNLVMVQELFRILDLLAAAEIPAIPIKGPLWAVVLHGDLGLRQFSDLDILVDPSDAVRAKGVLLTNGFRETKTRVALVYRDIDLVSADGVIKIDLQWGLTSKWMNAPFSFKELFERCESVKVLNRNLPNLCAEDLLLVLCLYCSKDLPWVSLSYIRDISAVAQRFPSLDWNDAMERARELGILKIFLFGLFLTDCLLALPLPEPIRAKFDDQPWLAGLASRVTRRMFIDLDRRHHEFPTFGERFEAAVYHFRVRERPFDRLRPMIYLPLFLDALRPFRKAGKRLARTIERGSGSA